MSTSARARLARSAPPGGADLYRHVARMVELAPGAELVVVPCGDGATVEYLAELSGAAGAGADPDQAQVDRALASAREAHRETRLHYEHAPLEDLPYRDAVFDLAVGEIGLARARDAGAAVRELARVTKPLGTVVLIQLSWNRQLDPERRRLLVETLGLTPLLVVEWKQMLRDAGVVELTVEDWFDAARALLAPEPLVGWLGELLALPGRIARLLRAWRRHGVGGARDARRRAHELRRLIQKERVLALSVIRGTRWEAAADSSE